MKKTAFNAGLLVLGFLTFCLSKTASSSDTSNSAIYSYSINLPSIASEQFAKATFLPEYNGDKFSDYDTIEDDYNFSTCDGYPLASCPTGGRCEACPFDAKKYKVLACSSPYIFTGETCSCPAATPIIYPNDVCTKYCGNTCIAKTCTPTANKTTCTNGFRNCDNGCGQNTRQCCNSCEHKITSKPANSSYTYSNCTDDDGNKQIQTGWTCNSGYHEKNGQCEKDCIANNCSGYTLRTCPDNATCSECKKETTTCGGGDTMYKKTGCKSGYKDCNGTCISSSTCCGGCPSGQECKNGSCQDTVDYCAQNAQTLTARINSFSDSARTSIAFCDAKCSNCGSYPMMYDCEGMRSKLISDIKFHNSTCPNNQLSTFLRMCPTDGLCYGGTPMCYRCMR